MKKASLLFSKFLLTYILLYLLSVSINIFGMVLYSISVFFISIPIILNNATRFSLKKEIKLIEYEKSKRFYNIISGKTFGYIIIITISLFFAFIIPVRIFLFSGAEFLSLFIIFPLFLISRFISEKLIYAIYNNKFALYKIENFSYIITAFLSAIIFPIISYNLKDISINIPFLDNSIDDLKYNYIAYIIGQVITFFDNITFSIFNAEIVQSSPAWFFTMLLVLLGGGGFIFYGIVNFICFFFIKKENLRKVFISAKKEDMKINKFLTAFIITLLCLFIYPAVFSSVAYISFLKKDMVVKQVNENMVAVEIINGIMYKAGTLNEIKIISDMAYGKAKDDIIADINKIYDTMLLNTDKYLDWYYSLPAEYNRLLKLLTGSIEEYMAEKLKDSLMDNISVNINFNNIEENIADLQNKIDDVLINNKIKEQNSIYNIQNNIHIDNIYNLAEMEPLIDLKTRLVSSTGGAIAVGGIVGAVASKIISKTTFKTATKVAMKVVAGKSASAAAGLTIGALSSLLTTPAGGIALGTLTGFAIDKSLLKLEEIVNRQDYKKEINDSIEENRKEIIEMISKVFGSPPVSS